LAARIFTGGDRSEVPANRDYYSILQVNPGANAAAIDAAYERLSKIYDPETSKKSRASERRAELEEAYEVLSDPKRRSEYDRLRSKGYRPGQKVPASAAGPGGVRGAARGAWNLLDNPYVFAGIAAMGVVVILVAIVLISVVGDDGDDDLTVLEPSPTAVAEPTPTLPAQTPGTPPASPPAVSGEPVTTGSGLQYIDIVGGTGGMPATGDRVVVNYTGWLQSDGTMFDSSVDNPEPFAFILGTGGVIAGWDEGVATMQKGDQRRLIIPPELAYGESGQNQIPPNATLIFDITLIEIFPAATPTPAPATDTPAAEVSPSP
jgi:peptidylprolyl isomerase